MLAEDDIKTFVFVKFWFGLVAFVEVIMNKPYFSQLSSYQATRVLEYWLVASSYRSLLFIAL